MRCALHPCGTATRFTDDQLKESAKRMLNVCLRVEDCLDALGSDPVVARAVSAQDMGTTGLTVFSGDKLHWTLH